MLEYEYDWLLYFVFTVYGKSKLNSPSTPYWWISNLVSIYIQLKNGFQRLFLLPTIVRALSGILLKMLIYRTKMKKNSCYNLHTLHWIIASLWNVPKNFQCKQTNEYVNVRNKKGNRSHSRIHLIRLQNWKYFFFLVLFKSTERKITGSQIDAKYSLYAFNFLLAFSYIILGNCNLCTYKITIPITNSHRPRHTHRSVYVVRAQGANDILIFNGCNFI